MDKKLLQEFEKQIERDFGKAWPSKTISPTGTLEALCDIAQKYALEQRKEIIEGIENIKDTSYQNYCGDECVDKALDQVIESLKQKS